MLQTGVLAQLKTPDLASFLDGSLMNPIPTALTNVSHFSKMTLLSLEKGEVLQRTALNARGPFPHSGDKEATEMVSKLHYNTSPIQEKLLHYISMGPFNLPVQLVLRKASSTEVLVLEIH